MLAAFVAESLGQVCLARSGRADEGQVPVGIDGSEGPDALELLQVGKALTRSTLKSKFSKVMGTF